MPKTNVFNIFHHIIVECIFFLLTILLASFCSEETTIFGAVKQAQLRRSLVEVRCSSKDKVIIWLSFLGKPFFITNRILTI